MYFEIRQKVAKIFADASGMPISEVEKTITMPKEQFGDFATSIAFAISKVQKKSPAAVAAEIALKIKPDKMVKSVVATGPYVNITLMDQCLFSVCMEAAKKGEHYGRGQKKSEKVLVEFPSVNPNKPWHIGHLRNALLGDSVARILEFCGYGVEREDYIDDLGLQVAQSFWGYLNLGGTPDKKLDLWLGEQYVEVSKRFESGEIEAQVRELLHSLEHSDSEISKKSRKLVEECVKAQYVTAFAYGIYHDVLVFESDIVKNIFVQGLEKIKASGSVVLETQGKNAGCLVVKLRGGEFDNMESPDKVLIRSDGTATYTGKDVVFQLWKFGLLGKGFKYSKFARQPNGKVAYMTDSQGVSATSMEFGNASLVLNVIGMEQSYPQKVIKVVLSQMGFAKEAGNSIHLSYEHATLPEGRFSGREGTWMGFTADALMEQGVERARLKITKDFEESEKVKISAAVALGAIRFSFLKVTPEKKILFDWDSALSMEGDSAPYIMYSLARTYSIFEKLAEKGPDFVDAKELQKMGAGVQFGPEGVELNEAERRLCRVVMQFENSVGMAAKDFRPHYMADYSMDLAGAFNKFYNTSPIMAAKTAQESIARIVLLAGAQVALKNTLGLLGVPVLKEM